MVSRTEIKLQKFPLSEVKKIAEMKMQDLNCNDIDAAIKIISGTARSIGIEIKEHGAAETIEQEEAPAEAKQTSRSRIQKPAEEKKNNRNKI